MAYCSDGPTTWRFPRISIDEWGRYILMFEDTNMAKVSTVKRSHC